MKAVVIIGSSRKDGNTRKLVDRFHSYYDFETIDLRDYRINHYDYLHRHHDDDFLGLIGHIINGYDTFIFATPVYWYAMSGVMKVFFDRLTDLLDDEKELGRKLRGKHMAVITSSVGDNLGDDFWLPFNETARYLGMHYIGGTHTLEQEDYGACLKTFANSLTAQTAK